MGNKNKIIVLVVVVLILSLSVFAFIKFNGNEGKMNRNGQNELSEGKCGDGVCDEDEKGLCSKDCDTNKESQGNTSSIKVENGVPKIVINGEVINNMFGVFVYSTGMDPKTELFLSEMKNVIDQAADSNIPIISFDIIRSDYDNSTTVPKDAKEAADRFYTENLDKIFDYAAEKDVYVAFQLLIHDHWALPQWWEEYGKNNEGYQILDEKSDPEGEIEDYVTPTASFKNDSHRELLKALMTRLVDRYKDHPAVAIWGVNLGPSGENGYGIPYVATMFDQNAPEIDFRTAMTDYSELAKENFHIWLEDKYGNINKLNNAWETDYSSFDEVVLPQPIQTSAQDTFDKNGDSRSSMLDWQQFRYDMLLDEWKFIVNVVKELDPNKAILGDPGWNPTWKQTGTENMCGTAEYVVESNLTEIHRANWNIVPSDNLKFNGEGTPGTGTDYANYIEYSRKNNTPFIVVLENWFTRGFGNDIPLERSLEVRDYIRDNGGYMWFVVSLSFDNNKPNWSWENVKEVVENSKVNEFENLTVKNPELLFYYDMKGLMSHYYEEKDDMRSNEIYYAISEALFNANDKKLQNSFISATQISKSALSYPEAKVLVMANQRVISEDVLKELKKFIADGGKIILIGSNGVFNEDFEKDTTVIEELSGLDDEQIIERFYTWGLAEDAKMPIISVTKSGTEYAEIPFYGEAKENYSIFIKAIGNSLGLSSDGELVFGEKTLENTGKCGDNVCDENETKNIGLCPQDCKESTEMGAVNLSSNSDQGKCGDGICDEYETQNSQVCPQDCD